jgi:uncharacterized protein YgiB involved in biofilm formation
MKKRSTAVQFLLCGAAFFALSACQDEKTAAQVFERAEECKNSTGVEGSFFSQADCDIAFAKSQAEHQRAAPRYDSKALCEEQHGQDTCGGDIVEGNNVGGGSSFMPFMAGYMIAQILTNNNNNNLARSYSTSQPLYPTKSGLYSTPNGSVKFSSLKAKGSVSVRALSTKPASTANKPPMTRASVSKSGGFGASRTSGAGRSSFGG